MFMIRERGKLLNNREAFIKYKCSRLDCVFAISLFSSRKALLSRHSLVNFRIQKRRFDLYGIKSKKVNASKVKIFERVSVNR